MADCRPAHDSARACGQRSATSGRFRDAFFSRRFARNAATNPADQPLLGIGDPLLEDHPAKVRGGAEPKPEHLALVRNARGLERVQEIASAEDLRQSRLELIRQQPSLPDTAAELEAIAKLFLAASPSLPRRCAVGFNLARHCKQLTAHRAKQGQNLKYPHNFSLGIKPKAIGMPPGAGPDWDCPPKPLLALMILWGYLRDSAVSQGRAVSVKRCWP